MAPTGTLTAAAAVVWSLSYRPRPSTWLAAFVEGKPLTSGAAAGLAGVPAAASPESPVAELAASAPQRRMRSVGARSRRHRQSSGRSPRTACARGEALPLALAGATTPADVPAATEAAGVGVEAGLARGAALLVGGGLLDLALIGVAFFCHRRGRRADCPKQLSSAGCQWQAADLPVDDTLDATAWMRDEESWNEACTGWPPAPITPAPLGPTPAEAAPIEPEPQEPAPAESAAAEPSLSEMVHAERGPGESEPNEPEPSAPEPSEPAPAEPALAEPALGEPEPAPTGSTGESADPDSSSSSDAAPPEIEEVGPEALGGEDAVACADRLIKEPWVSGAFEFVIFEEMQDELDHHRRRSQALKHFQQAFVELRGECKKLREAGSCLVEELERLQAADREAAGEIAYWRALAEESMPHTAPSSPETEEDVPAATGGTDEDMCQEAGISAAAAMATFGASEAGDRLPQRPARHSDPGPAQRFLRRSGGTGGHADSKSKATCSPAPRPRRLSEAGMRQLDRRAGC